MTETTELLWQLVSSPVSSPYLDGEHQRGLRDQFSRNGYVYLPQLLTDPTFRLAYDDVHAMESNRRVRDLVMPSFDTPRKMEVLSGQDFLQHSTSLMILYSHHLIRHVVQAIAGCAVYSCQHPLEFMVANTLSSVGDTHGWHIDDPAYALVLFLEAPPEDAGGLLEFISDWHHRRDQTGATPGGSLHDLIKTARIAGHVHSRHHNAADAYLLRANNCLHRVSELTRHGTARTVLNLAFEDSATPRYGPTASILYGCDQG